MPPARSPSSPTAWASSTCAWRRSRVTSGERYRKAVTRRVFLLIAAGNALIACCYGFARFTYGLFAPVFTDTFELTPTLTGVIGAGSYVGYCIAIVVSLILTERLGARWVAVAAGVVATVGISMVAAAPSAWVLAVGVLVAGCSTGIASPP